MLNWPSSLVTVVRITPVLVLVAVTVTPGRTASPWSSTRPLKVLVACANAMLLVESTTHATSQMPWDRRRLDGLIRLPSSVDGSGDQGSGIRNPRAGFSRPAGCDPESCIAKRLLRRRHAPEPLVPELA